MAVAGVIRRMLDGRVAPAGARAALCELELADYDRLFAERTIMWGVRDDEPEADQPGADSDRPLYARILGSAWERVPEPIRRLHGLGTGFAAGRATVERGTSPAARLIAWAFGFPAAGTGIPVRVRFDRTAGRAGVPGAGGQHRSLDREIWTRTFAGRSFASEQWAGTGRSAHLINERFGPFTFGLAVVLDGDCLRIVPRRWSFLGLPMPRALMPTGDTHERVEDGRFLFHVEIRLPVVGLIVRYRGHLVPVDPARQGALDVTPG